MKSINSRSHSARVPNWRVVLLCVATFGFALPASTAPDARQSTLFVNNCAQCHARPETGAPFIGVADDWQEAVARGEDAMLINVVQGIRGMPPLGYCSACTEEDLRVLIRMMAGLPDREGEQQ
jgi:cytochrome c5